MTTQRTYTPQGQARSMQLRVGEWNYFGITAKGQLEEDQSQVKCPGEGPGPRGQLAQADKIMLELRVRIQPEQFRSSHGQVESKKDHSQLPCLVRENGCQTAQKTYVWQNTAGDCHLKYI